jgi:hypothetical protein
MCIIGATKNKHLLIYSQVGVIISGSVWFLSKKITKPKFFLKKKQTETEPKPGQTDQFRFGSVWFSFFRAKTGSNRFGSVFPVLARFFRFGSVFPVWLGFGSFFSGFLSVSVRFGFFGFLFIKPKPNRPVFSKI